METCWVGPAESLLAPVVMTRWPETATDGPSTSCSILDRQRPHRSGSVAPSVGERSCAKRHAIRSKGEDMKPSTKDQVQGTIDEAKGKVKEEAGRVTNNPDLTNKGQAEKLAGKVQKKVGQVEKVLGK
jgi:uncharacterized protein YjbJ (UPF0337 family)